MLKEKLQHQLTSKTQTGIENAEFSTICEFDMGHIYSEIWEKLKILSILGLYLKDYLWLVRF